MLGAAGGDALLLGMLRGMPGDAWVRVHPSKMGSPVLGHPCSEVPPTLEFDPAERDPGERNDTEGGNTDDRDNSSTDGGLCKAVLLYGVFVLRPYVLHAWVQAAVRPVVQDESLRDLCAVAPNGLGAMPEPHG
jgi:hypothetical protein